MATGDYGDVGAPTDIGQIPPGYRINPQTGQLEPIPQYQESTIPGQTPWAPGSSLPSSSPPGMHWDANVANFVPDAPTIDQTGGGGGGGGGSITNVGQGLLAPFQGTAPAAPGTGTRFIPQPPNFPASTVSPPVY